MWIQFILYLQLTAVAKYDEKSFNQKVNRWEKIMLEAAQQCGQKSTCLHS